MNKTGRILLLVVIAVCSALPQQKKPACDNDTSFCWYDDEVDAWGNRWIADDPKANIEVGIAIRCVKNLRVCIRARSFKNTLDKNLTVTNIELMPVSRWDPEQITANAENYNWEPCERDSYIINRVDRSVILVSSPGPKSETSGCVGVHGKARTVTYKLGQ